LTTLLPTEMESECHPACCLEVLRLWHGHSWCASPRRAPYGAPADLQYLRMMCWSCGRVAPPSELWRWTAREEARYEDGVHLIALYRVPFYRLCSRVCKRRGHGQARVGGRRIETRLPRWRVPLGVCSTCASFGEGPLLERPIALPGRDAQCYAAHFMYAAAAPGARVVRADALPARAPVA
jgi:hypothetical protein